MDNRYDPDKFVIERCVDCFKHAAYTRHDEAKYKQFFKILKEQIETIIPGSKVLENVIPL